MSALSIIFGSILITQEQRHVSFAQLTELQSLNSSVRWILMQEFPVPQAPCHMMLLPCQMEPLYGIQLKAQGNIDLGQGSAPYGVIVGPDGAPWVTDGGLNAIVRVDPRTEEVRVYSLADDTGYSNLNTSTFDQNTVWFTGQSGIY